MPRLRTRAKNSDQRVTDALDIFEMSYEYSADHLDRFNKEQLAYNQIIDPDRWESSSEITLGQSYAAVQNMIAAIMYYTLWAPETPFEMIPRDASTTADTARKVRNNIVYTQRERMGLETQGFLTILNAMKHGLGYTLVEPKTIYPGDFGRRIAAAGTEVASMPSLGVGQPVQITSCRDIGVGRVYPTPDGANPNEVSAHTVLDYINEYDLRRLYQQEDHPYEGDPEEIIDYAKANKLNGYTASARLIADYLARRKQSMVDRMNRTGVNYPTLIPILKQYRGNEQIWLAADAFTMFHIKDKYQTLQSPLTKATLAPESNEWFTLGLVGRSYDIASGIESWVGAMLDLLSLSVHPHQIRNRLQMAESEKQEDVEPYGTTVVTGDVNTALKFMQWPQLPTEAFQVPQILQGFAQRVLGAGVDPNSATPGLLRGGSGALESVLQTSSGREKAAAKHLENGWYKDTTLQTLIHNQVLIGDKDEYTIAAEAGQEDVREGVNEGDKIFKLATVTSEDIRQDWRVEFNFREKLKNFVGEASVRIQQYDRLVQNPNISQEEAARFLLGDEYVADRLMRGVDVEANAEWIAKMQGGAGAQQGGAPPEAAGRGVGLGV